MSLAFKTNSVIYVNPAYEGAFSIALLRIATNSSVTSNLQAFLLVSSSASNQIWGGINRADVLTYGPSFEKVTSADVLEYARAINPDLDPNRPESTERIQLVLDELYTTWVSQGIGYFGDSSGSPLFLTFFLEREIQATAGEITNWSYNSESYYGFDNGPNLIYGDSRNNYLTGKDGKIYKLHACRWGTDNRVYIRLDNSTILGSDSYNSYTTSVFSTITINGTSYNASSVSTGFTINGAVGLYWNVATNPIPSVGNTYTIKFSEVGRGPYGAEFRNPSGKITLSLVDRVQRFVVASTTPTVPASGSTFVSVSGMQNNDQWNVFASISGAAGSISALSFTLTKSTGGFTIQNNDSSGHAYDYWVITS